MASQQDVDNIKRLLNDMLRMGSEEVTMEQLRQAEQVAKIMAEKYEVKPKYDFEVNI